MLIPALFVFALDAQALRCGNALVSKGDRKIEVVKKCGEPSLVESWREEVAVYSETDLKRLVKVDNNYMEEWTYNFGPNRFIHFMTFRNGLLEKIETGLRGYSGPIPADSDKTRCGKMLTIGDKKIDVLMKCGEPTLKEPRPEKLFESVLDKERSILVERTLLINEDEWTYNFGPSTFMYFIRFKNNEVVDIEQGEYGF